MKTCYLTGKALTKPVGEPPDPTSESLEHIIPNALGGTIKSRTILSHAGNQALNESVDRKFIKIFESFSLRLDLNKDRNGVGSPSMQGVHEKHPDNVTFKRDRFFPRKPFFDPNKRTIYANSVTTAKNYRKHLVAQGKISESDPIDFLDDMAGRIDLKFSVDNDIFKAGFAKIAAGFASLHGVARENLPDIIDTQTNSLQRRIIISPSIPVDALESEFESSNFRSASYPAHGLTLVGSRSEGLLYCHVDLFSCFQWYVLLNADYDGPDHCETYYQSTLDGKEINLKDYLASVLRPPKAGQLSKTYKKISRRQFIEFAKAYGNDQFHRLSHEKFNSLSAFANYAFLARKIKALGSA